jgi:hypothetical protein
VLFVTGPPAAAPVRSPAALDTGRTVRGASHIHTTRSDGALDVDGVAQAASRAGLRFAILTDHGDGTREPDPPAYRSGVLVLDGVEISTNDGHYVALGMRRAPYPLGGDAAAVVEDVARLGGFGVVAHPVSARGNLAWSDWGLPVDGLEWINADSEWRDESRLRLARAVIDYMWRPGGALARLLDRPVGALERWDAAASRRPVVAIAGHDAHGGLGEENGTARGRRIHIPSYEASFRTFSINATLERPFTGDAGADATELLQAIRRGHVFTAIDALAGPAALEFTATRGGPTARAGEILDGTGEAEFRVRAAVPSRATTILMRNGRAIAESGGGELTHKASLPGAYRVEIHLPRAPGAPPVPWVLSNPIYRFSHAPPPSPDRSLPVSILPLMQASWRVESAAESAGEIAADGESLGLRYRLRGGEERSQFVAFVVDLRNVPADVNTIVFRGRADAPMRVSPQLRFGDAGDARWTSSVYLDQAERAVRIPFEMLRAADAETRPDGGDAARPTLPPVRPAANRATSLLFVVDLTNARPGDEGSFTLRDVALARAE